MNIDFLAILKIIGIDIMLGVDNAIVIALACASLPPSMRNRAVLWGTAGAIALRAVMLAGAGYLFGLPLIKIIAGLYLVYVGAKLLIGNESDRPIPAHDKMIAAIWTIIVVDMMMSLDNVLAVVSAAQSAGEHSTLYAIAGIVLSIPIIIFCANWLMGMMERFPVIIWCGAALLGWIGAEMVISDAYIAPVIGRMEALLIQASGFALVILIGLMYRQRDKALQA